ncbi:sensor histidine kinase [Desulforhopalus sp. 52FAK]
MTNISLRWRILFFFCLLGLLPQVVISYFSMSAYTRSLEQTYTNQVSQLVSQVAEQTSVKSLNVIDDIKNQAIQPYLQLSFQQFPLNTRLQLLRERLELFRVSSEVFSRLDLCFLNGELMLSTHTTPETEQYASFTRKTIRQHRAPITETSPAYNRRVNHSDELAFFIPIHSFRNAEKSVGYMVAYVPLSALTQYLQNLHLDFDAEKSIVTNSGELINSFTTDRAADSTSTQRQYSAQVEPLGWKIVVGISEAELFGDVIWLKKYSIIFIAIVVVLAFAFIFVFSHRFTKPFKQIIHGTKDFATGNLDHKITVDSGHEAQQLATAFNDMANQLNDRQQELNQAVRLASLGVMTAGIAHEIKNPLTGIKTSSQVINKILKPTDLLADCPPNHSNNTEDNQLVSELAQGISDEADRLTTIVNDLLEFGRPREARSKPFSLEETVTHAISLVHSKTRKKQVQITTELIPHQVVADPDQILQVLLNLLFNALKAVPEHTGHITIQSELSPEEFVILRVIDNGSGIARDSIPRVFDPFFSLHDGGTGLGLSVVYTLLKQNNARIKVKSELNQGTEFKITFMGTSDVQEDRLDD